MIVVFDTEEYNIQIEKAKELQDEVYFGKKHHKEFNISRLPKNKKK